MLSMLLCLCVHVKENPRLPGEHDAVFERRQAGFDVRRRTAQLLRLTQRPTAWSRVAHLVPSLRQSRPRRPRQLVLWRRRLCCCCCWRWRWWWRRPAGDPPSQLLHLRRLLLSRLRQTGILPIANRSGQLKITELRAPTTPFPTEPP